MPNPFRRREAAFFVTPADHDPTDRYRQTLTEKGWSQVARAAQQLNELGLSRKAIFLASDSGAPARTAELLSKRMSSERLIKANSVRLAGQEPNAVASLRQVLQFGLSNNGMRPNQRPLVIFTHEPLLERVIDVPAGQTIPQGEVFEAQISPWFNPRFDEAAQRRFFPQLVTDQ